MRISTSALFLVLLLGFGQPARAEQEVAIQLFFATEENDNCITQVHYIIQLLNKGTEAVGPFSIHVVFDAPALPAVEDIGLWKGLTYEVADGIAAQDMFQIELWWKEPDGVKPGDYMSWLLIDITDALAETDETNNAAGPVHIKTEPILCNPPNLKIEKFEALLVGEEIHYSVQVLNTTEYPVHYPFRIDLFFDREKMPGYYDPGDLSTLVETLEIGASFSWEPVFTGLPGGNQIFESYCTVDGDNAVIELTEADNVAGPLKIIHCDGGECPPCEDEVEISSACRCGDEVVDFGLCCEGTHEKHACPHPPEQVIEADDDASAGPEPIGADLTPSDLAAPDPGSPEETPVADATDTGKDAGDSGGCSLVRGKAARPDVDVPPWSASLLLSLLVLAGIALPRRPDKGRAL
jgi:hypothetical protein